MDTKKQFMLALDSSTRSIGMVKLGDFTKHAPTSEWDVKALVSHMIYELYWTFDIVRGLTTEQVGASYDNDLIGGDLQANWKTAEARARVAVKDCDLGAVAHLSWMDATNDYYLKQASSDHLIHAWDLSAALGKPITFNDGLARVIYAQNYPRRHDMASSSLFKPVLKVAGSSNIQTMLLALFGRDINWCP